MNKRRKFYLLINGCSAIVFLILTLLSFYCSFLFLSAELTANINSFRTVIDDSMEYCNFDENTEVDLNKLIYMASNWNHLRFPHIFTIFDNEDGTILSETGAMLRVQDYDTNDDYVGEFYFNLKPYLTESIKEEIYSYCKDYERYEWEIRNLKFFFDGNSYIPVEFELTSKKSEQTKKIVFNDIEPNCFFCDNHDSGIADFIDLKSNFYNRRTYDKLYEYRNKCLSEIPYQHGLGGMSSATYLCYDGGVKISGKLYGICSAMSFNWFFDTLFSLEFLHLMMIQSVLFIIAYIAIMICASKFYKKNEQMTRAQRTFTSAAAHELKTPLAVIQNQCECVIENVAPEKNDEYIKSVYDEAVRMNGIVTNLLQYNRLVNTEKLQKEKCDLTEIILTETEKYKTFAETSGAELVIKVISDKCEINCNRDLISMAVDNFLSNAIKYATGEKRVVVQLVAKRVSVFNTCVGISAEMQKDLWNLLSRGSKARTKDGNSSGMGLPICAEIFKAHGYEYGCRNVRDGAEFYFQIK